MRLPYGTVRSARTKMRSSRLLPVASSNAALRPSRLTLAPPMKRLRSPLRLTKTGRGGRCCGSAFEAGTSRGMSTVASGAATMKMMSRTRITSMNGVTLISCTSSRVSVSCSLAATCLGPHRVRALRQIHITTDELRYRGGRVADQRPVAGGRARQHVVDDHRGNSREKPHAGGEKRFGNAGRHYREIGGLRLGDADEAVHHPPHRAEQADEGGGGADCRENAGAARHGAHGRRLDPLEPRGNPLAQSSALMAGELDLLGGGGDHMASDARPGEAERLRQRAALGELGQGAP